MAYVIRSFVIRKWFFFFFLTYQYLKRYLTHDRLGTCRVFAIEKLSNIYMDMYQAFSLVKRLSYYQLFLYLVDTVFFKTTIIINCNVVNVK